MSLRTWNLAGVQENLAESLCIGSSTTEISYWTPPSRNHPEPTPKPCILVITRDTSPCGLQTRQCLLFSCPDRFLSLWSVDLPSAALSYSKCCRHTDNETDLKRSGCSSPSRRRDKGNNVFTLKVTQTAGAQQRGGGVGGGGISVVSFLEA